MSGVNYYVRLTDEPSDDDLPRMTAIRAMVAALTGVDTERQGQGLSSGFSFGGHGPRWWSCRVDAAHIKRQWVDAAEFLLRQRLIDKYEWYGEIEPKQAQDWEAAFEKEFYEGLYGCAESDGEYYDASENVKKFIRQLLFSKSEIKHVCQICGNEDA